MSVKSRIGLDGFSDRRVQPPNDLAAGFRNEKSMVVP